MPQIRVGGVLASLFGFYYLGSAWGDLSGTGTRGFYQSTIWGRVWLALCFAGIVLLGELPPTLLVLALLNLLGAGRMARHLFWQK